MQISLNFQQAFLPLAIAYGLPFLIQVFYLRKKFEGRSGKKSIVLKFFWLISLILLALALTPITREVLYPSSDLRFSQNEIYKGVLLIFCVLLLLSVGHVVGFFLKDEKSEIESELKTNIPSIEGVKSSTTNRDSTSNSILSESFGGFIKGFKDGMKDANSKSKAEFFDVTGRIEEKKSRTLSDYLWQSIISAAIATGCGFGIYLNLATELNLLISLPCILGFIVFFVLTIIYAVRFKQLVDERGISIWDFFGELLLLAAFATFAVVIFKKEEHAPLKRNSSDVTYDVYTKVDYKNCDSPFKENPLSLKFKYKKETNEIFMASEFINNGTKNQQLISLTNCSIFDENNWSCGGNWTYGFRNITYSLVNGELSYEGGSLSPNCPVKIVKR